MRVIFFGNDEFSCPHCWLCTVRLGSNWARSSPAGDILSTHLLHDGRAHTFYILRRALAYLAAKHLPDTLLDYGLGHIEPRPQDESRATYTCKLTKADGQLRWEPTAAQLARQVAAYQQLPCWMDTLRGPLRVLSAADAPLVTLRRPFTRLKPGLLFAFNGRPFVLCDGLSFLELEVVQWPGKAVMTGRDLVNGYQDLMMSF